MTPLVWAKGGVITTPFSTTFSILNVARMEEVAMKMVASATCKPGQDLYIAVSVCVSQNYV